MSWSRLHSKWNPHVESNKTKAITKYIDSIMRMQMISPTQINEEQISIEAC